MLNPVVVVDLDPPFVATHVIDNQGAVHVVDVEPFKAAISWQMLLHGGGRFYLVDFEMADVKEL